ncbi:MAG TPA: hypothetical protein VMV77_12620 [Bacteroidales bacterium]|nr:hypothetical protein [Bacteroidales bacterium]
MKITKKSLINIYRIRNYNTYNNILGEQVDDFFDWFRLKSKKYRFDKDHDAIELPDTFIPELGKCYKNSQYYHFYGSFQYFEGFTSFLENSTRFINHAFNVENTSLKDFTYYYNREEVIRWMGNAPDFHVGIIIPPNIMVEIFENLDIDVEETRTNISLSISLLIAYYIIDSGLDLDIGNFKDPVEDIN